MAFWIRWKDTEAGAYTTLSLQPNPSDVDYPPQRDYKATPTQDGSTVVQRPLRDTRPRRWIWNRYRDGITPYKTQWDTLKTLEYRYRLEQGLYPYVEIWEDETGIGGFDRMSGPTKVWTVVKMLRVDRSLAKGGGRPIYDESFLEFAINDSTYTGF